MIVHRYGSDAVVVIAYHYVGHVALFKNLVGFQRAAEHIYRPGLVSLELSFQKLHLAVLLPRLDEARASHRAFVC